MEQVFQLPLAIAIVILVVGGILLWNSGWFCFLPQVVFWWIWLGLFIAIFESVLYANRQLLADMAAGKAPPEASSIDYWLQLWIEYAVHADTRYISSPEDPVHTIEFTNAIISYALVAVAIGAAVMPPQKRKPYITLLLLLLLLQLANCMIYFGTLPSRDAQSTTTKTYVYWLLSFVWIVLPIISIGYLGQQYKYW